MTLESTTIKFKKGNQIPYTTQDSEKEKRGIHAGYKWEVTRHFKKQGAILLRHCSAHNEQTILVKVKDIRIIN